MSIIARKTLIIRVLSDYLVDAGFHRQPAMLTLQLHSVSTPSPSITSQNLIADQNLWLLVVWSGTASPMKQLQHWHRAWTNRQGEVELQQSAEQLLSRLSITLKEHANPWCHSYRLKHDRESDFAPVKSLRKDPQAVPPRAAVSSAIKFATGVDQTGPTRRNPWQPSQWKSPMDWWPRIKRDMTTSTPWRRPCKWLALMQAGDSMSARKNWTDGWRCLVSSLRSQQNWSAVRACCMPSASEPEIRWSCPRRPSFWRACCLARPPSEQRSGDLFRRKRESLADSKGAGLTTDLALVDRGYESEPYDHTFWQAVKETQQNHALIRKT